MILGRQAPARATGHTAWLRWLLLLGCSVACFWLGTLTPSLEHHKAMLLLHCGIGDMQHPPPAAAGASTGVSSSTSRPLALGTQPAPMHGSSLQPQQQQQDPQQHVDLLLGANKAWCRDQHPPYHFPKIIHQTVKDKSNVSCEMLEGVKSWRDLNPEYEHRLYDDKDCEEFVAHNYPEILDVYRRLKTPVERADLWRYLVLHRYGGVYADMDVKCLLPIDRWNAHNNHDARLLLGVVFLDKSGSVKQVTNYILAGMPCHELLGGLAMRVVSAIAADALQGRSVAGEAGILARTGPLALTAALADYSAVQGVKWPLDGRRGEEGGAGMLVGGVRVMPTGLMAMGWATAEKKISCEEVAKRAPGTYICHQYFGSWKTKYQFKKQLTYRDSCKYIASAPTNNGAATAAGT